MNLTAHKNRRLTSLFALTLACQLGASAAIAAQTDISDTPLASAASDQVKPNIFFILDDSGSMARLYMPDGVSSTTVGFRNSSCNYVYYNPSTTYMIPEAYDGTPLNNGAQTTFTSAIKNGYYSYMSESLATTNLSTNFSANDSESGRKAYYWVLNNPTTDTSGTTLTPDSGVCNLSTSSITSTTTGVCYTTRTDKNYNNAGSPDSYVTGSAPSCGSGKTLVWRKVEISTSAQETNFAIWYTYYRDRMKMMKAATALSFANLTNAYRVGFMTIHPGTFDSAGSGNGSSVSDSKFLKISDFDLGHRQSWYSKLYSQSGNSATPLRTALSVAGRYYAGKNDEINLGMIPTSSDDPVQYSCQQNFSILTTDGYWNDGNSRSLNGTSQLSNQDGDISELDAYNPSGSKFPVSPRPMYDGATATYVYNTASNEYRTASCLYGTQLQTRSAQYQSCTSTNALRKRTSNDYGSSWTPWYFTSSCTADNSGKSRTQCSTGGTGLQERTSSNSGSTWTDWADTDSCSPDNSGSSRTQCRNAYKCESNSTWANGQCTNNDATSLPLCRSVTTAWADVGSCTPISQDTNGLATECQTANITGNKIQYRATITSKTFTGPNQGGSQVGGTQTSTGSWTDYDNVCHLTAPTLPTPGDVTGNGPPAPPNGCTSGTQAWPCETTSSTGGSSNTLADVAQYYYKNDLRPGNTSVPPTDPSYGTCAGAGALGGTIDVCRNNVSSSGTGSEDDRANWQHMTTFTMGLGLSGTIPYSDTYKTDTSGAFQELRSGLRNWPIPSADDPTALDDLWHAAVNGRGQYFSASNPNAVVSGLTKALSGITARVASAAAAATSNLEPVAGDNFAYTAKYVTQQWVGELEAKEIDLVSGEIKGAPVWSAQAKLDQKTSNACDTRAIKLFRSGGTNNLVDFKWNTDACDVSGNPAGAPVTTLNSAEQTYFSSTEAALLSQYANMSDGSGGTVNQRSAAAGANLVNFIRGQRGKEGFVSLPTPTSNDANKLYRAREHVLGDIVNAQPVYVRKPFAQYTDIGYSQFKTNNENRTPMVYVAANDGMLHAFNAGTSIIDTNGGLEAWAFIPTMVLPNLYNLASENYSTQHKFFVDGTPTAGDVFDSSSSADCALPSPLTPAACWKTILVGGLNKGGQGYYALDITDPATPKALWEFKNSTTCYNSSTPSTYGADCHIGFTYGKPIIGKLADGQWAVFVTSGLNNDNGIGYLYVLNAITGKIIHRISTGVGSSTNPSGLNQLAGWVENAQQNNTITRVYGVDMLGNIWRFDVNDTIAPAGREATLVAQVVDPSNTPQPITTRPRLGEIASQPFVFVATGRYLGINDKSDTQTQTIWAIKDPLGTTPVSNLRTTLGQRIINNVGTGTTAYRTVTTTSCTTGEGWYADLPDPGERVNVDIQLQLGTLIAASNVPSQNACNVGGYSWLNFFNAKTGCAVSNSINQSVGKRLVGSSGIESLAVGTNIVRLPGGQVKVISTTSGAEQVTQDAAFETGNPDGKRISWREIVQ